MLIRSQDKKTIINFDNAQSISICGYRVDSKSVYEDKENANTWYITCVSQDYSPFVGHYSTEAKAIKVLDAIQTAYELSLYCDHAYDSSAQIQRPYIFVNNTVFQMPQDEEVEV